MSARPSCGKGTGLAWWDRNFREISVAGVLMALLGLMAILAPNFFEPQPLLSRLTSAAPRLLIAGGVALVILIRQIDISVGSVFAFASVLAGSLLSQGWPMPVVMPMAILAGSVVGAINGGLVAGLGLPSIVVTLATLVTLREALRLAQQGVFINLPDTAQWFGGGMNTGQLVICGVVMLLWTVMALGLRQVTVGRHLYAVGSDAEAARLSGLRPRWMTFWTFVVLGGITGLAAILSLVQGPQVDPATGRQLELETIAAAVVGGMAISGGRGSLWGVFVGFLLLTCIGPALTYLGIKPFWDKAIQGAVILLAVVADGWRRRKPLGTRVVRRGSGPS